MNKSELIKAVAEKTSLTQAQAKEAVNTALDVIKEATLEEGKVSLAEFGTFKKFRLNSISRNKKSNRIR